MSAIPDKSAEQNKIKIEKQRIREASLVAAKRVREVVKADAVLMVVFVSPIFGSTVFYDWS